VVENTSLQLVLIKATKGTGQLIGALVGKGLSQALTEKILMDSHTEILGAGFLLSVSGDPFQTSRLGGVHEIQHMLRETGGPLMRLGGPTDPIPIHKHVLGGSCLIPISITKGKLDQHGEVEERLGEVRH
jgi:hypothetical protein